MVETAESLTGLHAGIDSCWNRSLGDHQFGDPEEVLWLLPHRSSIVRLFNRYLPSGERGGHNFSRLELLEEKR